MVPALSPVPATHASNVSSAAMAQYQGMLNTGMPGFGDLAAITILLVAPVGVFLLAAGIGGSLRQTEVWTGPALTLMLSSCAAYVLAGSSSFSMTYLLLFLQWIAFLVQPFSILASVLVLGGPEKFRRSIEYTITPDEVVIRGGVFKHVEQSIPHHHIGRVILEQDLVGSRFNYGTVIPRSTTSRHAAISFWCIKISGQKDPAGPVAGSEGSIGTSPGPARLPLRDTGSESRPADSRKNDLPSGSPRGLNEDYFTIISGRPFLRNEIHCPTPIMHNMPL